MRIAFIGAAITPRNASAVNRVTMFAEGLAAQQGNEVDLFIPFIWEPDDRISIPGVRVNYFYRPKGFVAKNSKRFRARVFGRIRCLMVLIKKCFLQKYDCVFYYPGWNMEGLLVAVIARMFGIGFCIQHCDMTPENMSFRSKAIYSIHRVTWRWSAKLSSAIVVISTAFGKEMKRFAPDVPIIEVPIMVDLEIVGSDNGSKIRNRLKIPEKTKVIAYGGSLSASFGVGDVIDATAMLKREKIDWHLIITGAMKAGSSRFIDVSGRIREKNIEERATYVGFLTRDEYVDLVATAHVLIVPKGKDSENMFNMPSKLAECLASGRPVVAAKIGGIRRYLKDGYHALLYEPGNTEDLANCILRVLEDDSLASRLGENGRRLAKESFDYLEHTRHLSDVLREICESKRR